MKTLFLTLLALPFFTACGGGNKSNATEENRAQESGTCSEQFLIELNGAEISLKLYKAYGLKSGADLVQAHSDLVTLQEKYSVISCQAKDSESGEIVLITKEKLKVEEKSIFDLLYRAHFYDCKSSASKTSGEKDGCNQIGAYMKKEFGYE